MDGLAKAIGSRLEHLSLFNALLDARAVEMLTSTWHCPSLTSLNLSWNRVCSAGAKALARSLANGSCPRLAVLNLSHSLIHGDALLDLAEALRQGPRTTLKKLSLGWNPLCSTKSQDCITDLHRLASALGNCPCLESLNMSNVDLGPEGAKALATGLGCRSSSNATNDVKKNLPSCTSVTVINVR